MHVDTELVLAERAKRAWSQEDLADAAGLNLRTVQRIEKSGAASQQSVRGLAMAFGLDIDTMTVEQAQEERCPECNSLEIYSSVEMVDSTTIGGALVPKLASKLFSSAKLRPVLCGDCGLVRFFVEDDARSELADSKHWRRR